MFDRNNEVRRNIYDIYDTICSETEHWSYYQRCFKSTPFSVLVKNAKCGAVNFILEYFTTAGKQSSFETPMVASHITKLEDRSKHMLSVYLLGIIFAEQCFKTEIDSQKLCLSRNRNSISFLYLWFLTSLFHDIGYVFEDDKSEDICAAVTSSGIKGFLERNNLLFKVNERNLFQIYTKSDINDYFKYRADEKNDFGGVIDHGIAGGLLLYYSLEKQFYSMRPKCVDSGNETEFLFSSSGAPLRYSKKNFKCFGVAADAIMAHNVYVDSLMKCRRNYKKTTCTDNNTEEVKKISKKDIMCFLLCICDTLEPLKRFEYNIEILKHIKMECTPKCITLWFDSILMDKNEFYGWCNSIEKLEEWTEVQVWRSRGRSAENYMVIQF